MPGKWSVLNERVIAGAVARQAKAMAELIEAYGTPEKQRAAYAWHDFMRQADECGHRWGEDECACDLCADVGRWITTSIQQMQQMTGQTNG